MNRFGRLLLLVFAWHLCLLLCLPAVAQAQTCAFNLRMQFADGAIACLDSYPFFQRVDRSWSPRGTQVIALSPVAPQCKPAMAVSGDTVWNAATPEIERDTLEACRSRASKDVAGCDCRIVYSNGRSPLTAREFELFTGKPKQQTVAPTPLNTTTAAAIRTPEQLASVLAQPDLRGAAGRDRLAGTTEPSHLGAARAAMQAVEAAGAHGAKASASAALSCPPRFIVKFADGVQACLTSFPLIERVIGFPRVDLKRAIPDDGVYTLAASPADDRCTASAALNTLREDAMLPYSRSTRAVEDCRSGLHSAGIECDCRIVVVDGRSGFTEPEFERYAGRPAAPLDLLRGNPIKESTSTAPNQSAAASSARPAVSAQMQGQASIAMTNPAQTSEVMGSTAYKRPPAEEVAELRRQIDELVKQQAQTTQSPPSPQALAPVSVRSARALVIGNGAYAHLGTLPNPRRDAQAIAGKLRSIGIDVDLVLDAGRERLVKALSDFQLRSAGVDVNLLFYAGHGLQVGGVNYIVPVDMKAEGASAGSVKLNTVSLNDAMEYLPSATRVVFLDACRDNPIARSLRTTRGSASGLAAVDVASGTLISFATKDGAVAEDGDGANSPYTTALLRHLDAPLDVAIVLRRVRQEVLQTTGNRQEPWEYGSLVGDQLILAQLAKSAR